MISCYDKHQADAPRFHFLSRCATISETSCRRLWITRDDVVLSSIRIGCSSDRAMCSLRSSISASFATVNKRRITTLALPSIHVFEHEDNKAYLPVPTCLQRSFGSTCGPRPRALRGRRACPQSCQTRHLRHRTRSCASWDWGYCQTQRDPPGPRHLVRVAVRLARSCCSCSSGRSRR